MNGSLRQLDDRVHAMVRAADTVALHPVPGADATADAATGVAPRRPTGAKGRFLIESVNAARPSTCGCDLASGEVEASSYRALRHLMRCQRAGARDAHGPAPHRAAATGSRSARARKSSSCRGSARRCSRSPTLSYHTRGMAADIRVPGVRAPLMVRDLARAMGVKGIGYYPVSQFVHVDVRGRAAGVDRLRREQLGRRGRRARAPPRQAGRGQPDRVTVNARAAGRRGISSARSVLNDAASGWRLSARSTATYSPAARRAFGVTRQGVRQVLGREQRVAREAGAQAVDVLLRGARQAIRGRRR